MMRALVPLFMLVGACAAPAAGPPPATPAQAAAKPALLRTGVEGFGLSAEFTQAPKSSTQVTARVKTVYVEQSGAQAYHLTAVSTRGRDRPTDAAWYESLRKKMGLTQQREVLLSGFEGVELAGESKGQRLRARLFAVGDTLFVAEAIASKEPLNEAAAERFFSSLELELPWRIHASKATKFSVMVPANAIIVDRTDSMSEGRSSSLGFFVGGPTQRTYWATAEELVERDPEVTDDFILDAALDGMRRSGSDITWQGPLTAPGMRGREFLAASKDAAMMGRVWLTERFLYVLLVSAKTREGLQAADAAKCFGSFVAY